MDIPLPDELEFLEANSHFDEDYLDPYDDEGELVADTEPQNPEPSPSIASEPSLIPIDGYKRLRLEGSDSQIHLVPDDVVHPEEKRSRTDDSEANMDEDWLRYSPSRGVDSVAEQQGGLVAKERTISRYALEIDGDFVPITAPSSGERVYAKLCWGEWEERLKNFDSKVRSKGLIPESISDLLQRVEQEAFAKQVNSEDQDDVILPETPVMHEQLWVDKYAPSSFTELLSNEQTNREVLLWLKQWDSCVFGSEIRTTSDDVLFSLRQHMSMAQHHKVSNSSFPRKNSRVNGSSFWHSTNLDHKNRNSKSIQDLLSKKSKLTGPPENKILLLCGPPGLGKTTLAHVAAKHCGYRVVEVNASDDRSSSTIESKILDAVQMNSVMADAKPKCLIIDEIDGALGDGKGAVEVILKMVSAEKKFNSRKENISNDDHSGRGSTKKGRKDVSLSRPVICICNDLYAPALRSLRQIAKVHVFVQPTASRIVSRLKYICNKEGMKTSSVGLSALAECTECDIRSCLNTLQFLNKKKETLNPMEISSQVVGKKDVSRSVFDVWKEIFYKRKKKQQGRSDYSSGNMPNELDSLYSLVSYRGDYDLILDGIHENILQLHYHDPMMQKTVDCVDSLGGSDLMHQYIMRSQQMALLVYQPHSAINVHRLVAQVQKPNIEWPKSFQRFRTMHMEKMDILTSWHHKIPPHISRHLSNRAFVEDSISQLLHILSPSTLRPVATHLLSQKEKDDLAHLVSTMVSCNISYKYIKTEPLHNIPRYEAALDVPVLAFDPPINDFVKFKDYMAGHHVLALAVKQVLAHEVEKQKILQASNARSLHLTDGRKEETSTNKGILTKPDKGNNTAKDISNLGQCNSSNSKSLSNSGSDKGVASSVNLKPSKVMKKPSAGPVNFFDRFRKLSSKGPKDDDAVNSKELTLQRDLRPVLFKFNEVPS